MSLQMSCRGEKEVLRSIRVGHTISMDMHFSLLPSFRALFRKMEKDESFAWTYAEIPCYKMTVQEWLCGSLNVTGPISS